MKAELNPIRKLLHWIIAIMVIAMIPAGLIFTDFDNKPMIESLFGQGAFDQFYNLHKSMGLTILGLMAVRILAMLIWPAPDHKPPLGLVDRVIAKFTHGALLSLLVVVPVLGWAGVSMYPAPLPWFGVFDAPPIAPENREASEFVLSVHGLAAFTLAGLAVIHIGAAIWHRSVRRDGVFDRISLFPARKPRGETTPAE